MRSGLPSDRSCDRGSRSLFPVLPTERSAASDAKPLSRARNITGVSVTRIQSLTGWHRTVWRWFDVMFPENTLSGSFTEHVCPASVDFHTRLPPRSSRRIDPLLFSDHDHICPLPHRRLPPYPTALSRLADHRERLLRDVSMDERLGMLAEFASNSARSFHDDIAVHAVEFRPLKPKANHNSVRPQHHVRPTHSSRD